LLRLNTRLVALTLISVIALTAAPLAQRSTKGRASVTGEIIVKFRPGLAASEKDSAHRAARGTSLAEIQRTGLQRIRVPAGEESATIARYRRNPNVLYAEPNFVRTIPAPLAQGGASEVVPGDLYFSEQWALNNTGQQFLCLIPGLCFYAGTAGADIDAPEAWEISTGSSDVTVAVIDSGIDYTHPDLAANYAGGVDFVSPDGDPMDDHGHGTHVAGIIAAALDNLTGNPGTAEGVVGVAPHARIRAYKVCRADGTCDDFAIQQAIARAITDGAKVINMSLGETAYSQSLDQAVQDAWNAGLVIVAGAGNDGTTERFYPAALDHVISVAAFDEDHRRPPFSNYGSWVDISAPGNVILSTYPSTTCAASTVPGDSGCYTWLTGTSMATPFVAGAAALLWFRPDVTSNSEVLNILLNSADGQGVGGPRLDSWTIHGGLNLRSALTYSLTRPVANAGTDQSVLDNDGDGTVLVTVDGSASFDRNGTIVGYTWREGNSLLSGSAIATIPLTVGAHTLTLEVTDNDGETGSDTIEVTIAPSRQVSVIASTPQATEAGSTSGVFTFSRTGNPSGPLTVFYTVEGTARAGTDYQLLSGQVTFQAGASSASVAVASIDDAEYESNETVIIAVLPAAGYFVGSPVSATVTIVSDDLPPDLMVSSCTAPSLGGSNADVAVTDTTKNQGAGWSPSSNTGFYLSTTITWDSSDAFLGTRVVPALIAGGSDAVSTTVRLPLTSTGTYFILARADWDGAVQEGAETNNVKSCGAIKIGPDLIVSAVTAPATAGAGGPISVSDTTKNQGGGSAELSTTRFYLSTNATVDASDVMLGVRPIRALSPGDSDADTMFVMVPAGTAAGSYYVLAQADTANAVPETSESNNSRASGVVKVGPDLIVSAVSAPATGAAGAPITVSDTTRNQGAGAASLSSTGFYLSTRVTIDSTAVFLGSRPVGELSAGGTGTGAVSLQIPPGTAPGSYYVIARGDWNGAVPETTETNNDRSGAVVRIGGDLVVTAVTAPAVAMANGAISVTDTTKNQGTGPVPQSATGFYLSVDLAYGASDVLLGSRAVGPLGVSQTSTTSTQLWIPAGTLPGTYYVVAVADWNGLVPETAENNNGRVSGSVRIGPDVIVAAVTAPFSAAAGATITAGNTTTNQGGDTIAGTVTSFYLSTNLTLDAGDLLLASRPVPSLAPGASDAASVALVIPGSTAPGTYYIIARADDDDAIVESLENNNTRAKSISILAAQ
jgi:subtilisin family serine protease/subtilase family serine protease